MNETVNLSDFLFEVSIRGMIRILAEMAGISPSSVTVLLVLAGLLMLVLLVRRFDEPIIWFIFGKPEPVEPAPLIFNSDLNPKTAQVLVGREGVAQAPLRPMGNVKVDGRTYTMKSEGIYIDPGTPVRVDRIEGPHIIVVPVLEDT